MSMQGLGSSHNLLSANESELAQALVIQAERGNLKAVQTLAKKVKSFANYRSIYFKSGFEAAARAGHLKVMQCLYNYLDNFSDAIGGLYEAARAGKYLAAEWILNRESIPFTSEQLLCAISTASLNRHWSLMQLCMIKAGWYIDTKVEQTQAPAYVDDEYFSSERREFLVMHPLSNASMSTKIMLPKNAHVPEAIQGRETIECKSQYFKSSM